MEVELTFDRQGRPSGIQISFYLAIYLWLSEAAIPMEVELTYERHWVDLLQVSRYLSIYLSELLSIYG